MKKVFIILLVILFILLQVETAAQYQEKTYELVQLGTQVGNITQGSGSFFLGIGSFSIDGQLKMYYTAYAKADNVIQPVLLPAEYVSIVESDLKVLKVKFYYSGCRSIRNWNIHDLLSLVNQGYAIKLDFYLYIPKGSIKHEINPNFQGGKK